MFSMKASCLLIARMSRASRHSTRDVHCALLTLNEALLDGPAQECIAAAAAERKKQKSLVTEPTVAFKVCGHCKQRKVGPRP